MKPYVITAMVYSEKGAPTSETIRREFDYALEAKKCYSELKSMKQSNGFSQYGNVELHVLAEKTIANPTEFFANFEG